MVSMVRVKCCISVQFSYCTSLGRLIRQSLSSHTANVIKNFQKVFGDLQDAFHRGVSIQNLVAVDILRKDLGEIKETISENANNGEFMLPRFAMSPQSS